MVRKMMLLALGASVLGLSTGAEAASITYTGSQQLGSILATYSIVTDGTLGSLVSVNHVTGFNVTLQDSLSTISYGRTSVGGNGSVGGTNFAATATGLTIPLFESLSLYTNATAPSGGVLGFLEFRYNSTYVQMDDAAHGAGLVLNPAESNRTVPFATATAAVAEPATWGMLLLGFGTVGFAMRRQRVSTRVRFA